MSDATATGVAAEMRVGIDRRNDGWRTVYYGFLRSRRRNTRRDSEAEPMFTDWHHPWLFFLAVGTMLLSCVDAFMTLQLLNLGAVEINPIMNAAIGTSTVMFAGSKIVLTGVGILILVYLSRARFMDKIRTGIMLTAVFSFYACLVCYEFVFLLRLLQPD